MTKSQVIEKNKKQIEIELDLLLSEFWFEKDKSRIANVLEAVVSALNEMAEAVDGVNDVENMEPEEQVKWLKKNGFSSLSKALNTAISEAERKEKEFLSN